MIDCQSDLQRVLCCPCVVSGPMTLVSTSSTVAAVHYVIMVTCHAWALRFVICLVVLAYLCDCHQKKKELVIEEA